MGRPIRIDVPGYTYHVISRGVKKLPLFYEEGDQQRFIMYLLKTREKFPFRLHAYCLMTNHFHLLLQTIDHSLSQTMQYFKTMYATWVNRRTIHVGHAFQGRFHSIPVEKDNYFTTVARYIHLNPVKAGIVQKPEDYPWSNYGRLIRGETDPLVDSSQVLGYFGIDPVEQRRRYKQFVEDLINKPGYMSDKALQRMRFWGKPPQEVVKLG